MSSIERLEKRILREKTARLEAEKIADAGLRELNLERESLAQTVEFQASELRHHIKLIEESRVRATHSALWEIGDRFNSAGFDDVVGSIRASLEGIVKISGALSAGVWEIEQESFEINNIARFVDPESTTEALQRVKIDIVGQNFMSDLSGAHEGTFLVYTPSAVEEVLPQLHLWNPGLDEISEPTLRLGVGVVRDLKGKTTIIAASFRSEVGASERDKLVSTMIRGVMGLLRQFLSRIDLQNELLLFNRKQSEVHSSFMKAAGKLMMVEDHDLDRLVTEIMQETAFLVGALGITDWKFDYESERYELSRLWLHPSVAHRSVVESAAFGSRAFLDATREAGGTLQINPETPTLAEPNRISVVRSRAGVPTGILMAAKLDPNPWNELEIEILERLSALLLAVETRLSSDTRANAAIDNSPMPIALRSLNGKLLLDCNEAFLKMVGRTSAKGLLGTPPETLLFQSIEDVDPKYRVSSKWMFDNDGYHTSFSGASNTSGGTTDLVYRGPQGRPILAETRCVEVTPSYDKPFLLVHADDVTEKRQAEHRLRSNIDDLAFINAHDDLTGLFNRRGILQTISEMDSESGGGALAIIDLDRFKNVNDSLGHETGNIILEKVAEVLQRNVRDGDAVGRLYGDEFVVVLRGPVSEVVARAIVQKIMDQAGALVAIDSHRYYPSLSVGIAYWNSFRESGEAFRQADAAMYAAKRDGGNRLVLYDDSMKLAEASKQQLEVDLRQAIERDEFCVHYQPVFSMENSTIVGVEALVRWQHPERGLLVAGSFIEDAEQMGFASEIGLIVLRIACTEARTWPIGTAPFTLNVNIAASQIANGPALTDHVSNVLMETGFDAGRLCLEVTESSLIGDLSKAEQTLAELSRLGLQLALDDFGTGYSGLTYLKRLKVDTLKIDKSFVNDLTTDEDSVKFVQSIINLADMLDLGLVVEGVETEAQAEMLRSLGCDRAQGWHFHKAMPAEALERLLAGQADSVTNSFV